MPEEKPRDRFRHYLISGSLLVLTLGLFFSCSQENNTPVKPGETPVFGEYATGLIKDPKRAYGVLHFSAKNFRAPLADEYDVETDGGKTPVRDQKQCGSCWAFASTQTFEIGTQKFGGKVIDFSEQDLVGKLFYGCGGGFGAGEFQTKTGQTDEASCPYSWSNKKCSAPPVAKATNYGMVGQPNRSPTDIELQTAIQTYGSVWVTIGADRAFTGLRPNGQIVTQCPRAGTNHMVTLVGWKTVSGKIYYKMKNSWGTGWGDGGYAYIAKGCWNMAEEAGWLSVEQTPCQPPKGKLAKEIVLNYGDEVRFAVKPEQGVTYAWYRGEMKLADGPTYDLLARESLALTLKTKNNCGEGETMSIVTVSGN